ncbi:MAG TPA: hypothetical protein VFC45_11800 [Pseudolabrys sp.]|nr:hypothetical protein [Pseudolabrys sp.]
MNLQKQVIIFPVTTRSPTPNQIGGSKQLSLFEAVRIWIDDEGVPFDIVDEGKRLTEEKIQEIAHSEAYKGELLAFDERR